MQTSVFIDEITKNVEINFAKNQKEGRYTRLAKQNNPIIALICLIMGTISFAVMGYYVQSDAANFYLQFTSFISFMFAMLIASVVIWITKSFVVFSVWNGIVKKAQDSVEIMPFFTITGMSNVAFALLLPFFLVGNFFSNELGVFLFGAGVFYKYFLEYKSYDAFFKLKPSEKFLLTISSIFTLILMRTIILVLFDF